MRSKCFFLLIVLVTSCNLFPYGDFRYSPAGVSAPILLSYDFVSYSTTEIIYDIRLANFSYYNDIYYDGSSYKLEGPGTLRVAQIDGMEITSNTTSSSVILLDQSGSYMEIDPHNLRSKIINKFLDDFESPDKTLLGGFSKDGLLQAEPVEYAENDFSSEWNDREFLFDLSKRTGGSCPLYDAISSAIDKLTSSSGPGKNIIVLTHASDAGSSTTRSELISKAKSQGIKISSVILGSEPLPSDLWECSQETGGMMATCPSDLQLITILNHLERLIKGTVYITRLRISFKPASGNVLSGAIYENQISVVDQTNEYEFNPVYVKIKIP